MKIRVVVADDHIVLLDGISRIIEMEDDIEVVGRARNGLEALMLVEEHKPDVVLMDINMPVMDGLEATQRIKEVASQTEVLILTMFDEEGYFFPMIAAGASGYLLKESPSYEVIQAIRIVSRGESMIHPSLAKKLLDSYCTPSDDQKLLTSKGNKIPLHRREKAHRLLTPREIEVLRLLIAGETNKEIADSLYISDKTVKIHVNKIFKKFEVKSRSQAIIYAVRNKVIDMKKP
jgi:DNA-binding NarL/FixJ family response regulator